MPYTHYPIQFKKNKAKVQALLNSSIKVNAMILAYTAKLGLKIWLINIRAQKIDSYIFEILEISLASFEVKNKLSRAYFFQKISLLANININVILEMFFLIFSNANIVFVNWKLV